MPSFAITARERRFSTTVNATISGRAQLLEAHPQRGPRGLGRIATPQ